MGFERPKTEQELREESIESVFDLAEEIKKEIGENAEGVINWFLRQDSKSFSRLLLDINRRTRGISLEEHRFDGENVQAGIVGISVPPDQEDKITLIRELIELSHQDIQTRINEGEDY